MPERRWSSRGGALVLAVLLAGLGACGEERDEVAATGAERANQTREAALDAWLDAEVADFLALLARGDTATYEVRFPGPTDGTELRVVSRPPQRRVEVLSDGTTTEVRLVTGGQAFTCTPEVDGGRFRCERTDALVDPPGVFRPAALEELRTSLAERTDDYTFDVEVLPVAGVEARCLVTRLRSGREAPGLGASRTICASPEGAVVLVDQGADRLEATEYSADVADDAFERPDVAPDGDGT